MSLSFCYFEMIIHYNYGGAQKKKRKEAFKPPSFQLY